ncbi:hypothetical protein [Nocardia amikacinitolerans]|nr:hypothetical protein [Nocardia amikacinitolerans]
MRDVLRVRREAVIAGRTPHRHPESDTLTGRVTPKVNTSAMIPTHR